MSYKQTERYNHHGTDVSVISSVKGQHREHCLCWQGCKHFTPENRDTNCKHASNLYNMLTDKSNPILVTPVYECAAFEQ